MTGTTTATTGAPEGAPVVVVMGVSGSGKSTVGRALAERLGVPFADGDDLHPAANRAKMKAGTPLDDDDRRPWLDVVGRWLAAHPGGGVMACSALTRAHRDQLRAHRSDVTWLHLAGDPSLITERQAARPGHFMPSALMGSQLATLQPLGPDEGGLVVDVARSVTDVVDQAARGIARAH